MRYWNGEDRYVLILLRLSALTGEHANYSQVITIYRILTFHSLYDYFGLLNAFITIIIPYVFINVSKTNYLLMNYPICTTPDTDQIVILILHFLII